MYSGHNTFVRPTNRSTGKPMFIFADRKGGFPHSEITGSKGARASPVLIAACHVLHRLSMPRHPSEALMRLIVLSKTHDRTDVRTCALSDNDVFSGPSWKRGVAPEGPFIHDVNRRSRSGNCKLVHPRSRGAVVEPDGIEPTTSCLQSTRSTN